MARKPALRQPCQPGRGPEASSLAPDIAQTGHGKHAYANKAKEHSFRERLPQGCMAFAKAASFSTDVAV